MEYNPFYKPIKLKPLYLSDACDIYPLFHDSEIVKFLPQNRHTDTDQTKTFLSLLLDEERHGHGYVWKIVDTICPQDKTIGLIDIIGITRNRQTGSLAYVIGRDYWGRGIGTYIIKKVLKKVFRNTRLKTIYAPVVSRNPGSKKVLMKNGFVLDHVNDTFVNFDGEDDLVEIYKLRKADFI